MHLASAQTDPIGSRHQTRLFAGFHVSCKPSLTDIVTSEVSLQSNPTDDDTEIANIIISELEEKKKVKNENTFNQKSCH